MAETSHRKRGAFAWDVVDVSVWLSCVGVAAWKAWYGGRASVLIVAFGVFALFRLVSTVTLIGVDGVRAASSDRREVVAGWLWIGRPLGHGALLVTVSIAALALYPHGLGIVLGVIGLLVGQGFVIFGLNLLREWRRAKVDAAKNATLEPTR